MVTLTNEEYEQHRLLVMIEEMQRERRSERVSGLGSAALRHGAHAGHPAPPGDDRLFADPEGHVLGLSSGM